MYNFFRGLRIEKIISQVVIDIDREMNQNGEKRVVKMQRRETRRWYLIVSV